MDVHGAAAGRKADAESASFAAKVRGSAESLKVEREEL